MEPDDKLLEDYNRNNQILKIFKTENEYFDINKIIENTIKKNKITNVDVNKIKELVKKYPLIKDFVTRLSKEFDKYCYFIVEILDSLFRPIYKTGLTNFKGKSFYLDI